jgi:anti-sigma factor RsiW
MSPRINDMDSNTSPRLTEDQIHALVDGQLAAGELAALQARLAQEPDAQASVLKWQQQRDALRDLHQHVLDEPVPSVLRSAASQTAASQQELNQWWRGGGLAASVMLAFGVGWFSHTAWQSEVSSPAAALAKARSVQDFARQASVAHVVYSPEVRHPVEVTAAEQEHLVQWLSKRVGKPLKVPHLGALGYELVGGRLLPGEAGARAQFMFQNMAGTRITLYLGAVEPMTGGPDTLETRFQFAADGPIPSFYWVDQGFGYALAGPVPRDALLKLAEAVYRQL